MKFKEANNNSFYLGLPSMIGRKKFAMFDFINEYLQKRLQGRDKKKLSKDGKEILIKSAAQKLPSYAMNVFLLTVKVY